MDQQWSNTQHGVPLAGLRPGNGPAVERSLNGDEPHFRGVGGRGRRTRLSQSESHVSHAEEERTGSSVHRGLQAEGGNQRGTRVFFGTKRPLGQEQDTAARSPGAPRRQSTRGRNRAPSETEQGSRVSRGPSHRKRGLSETQGWPNWDNTKMSGLECLAAENIWFDKSRYDDAERHFYEGANTTQSQQQVKTATQPAKGRPQKRQHRNSSSNTGIDQELISRIRSLELENNSLYKVVEEMRASLQKLESRVCELERSPAAEPVSCAKGIQTASAQQSKVTNGGGDDDDMDLFGSDEEDDAEAERVKQERVAAYAAKKATKPVLIAKSSILLDVKPWDDETDMSKLEECVRSVQADGLLWGASKLVAVGYGIKKLQINCVVEDDKVGTDMLEEEIVKFEDYVQSVDVAAFNKI